MKSIFALISGIAIVILFAASSNAFALTPDIASIAATTLGNINEFIMSDTTSKGSRNKPDSVSNLGLIRKQNVENVDRMLFNRKLFPLGRRRVVAYAGMQYDAQRKPEIKEIISKLKDLGVNCYSYLIDSHSKEELSSLPQFCALASKSGIEVWVVLVPPSEEPGHPGTPDTSRYPPYGLNYVKWAKDISTISKSHPNLTLLMIDDFIYNLNLFTPTYTKEVFAALKRENHDFLLGMTIYEDQLKMKKFDLKTYSPYIGAVEWGYQHNAHLSPNYGISATSLPVSINNFRKAFPNSVLIPCLYFTPHSSWSRKATVPYLKEAMTLAYQDAGVVLIFRTPASGTVEYNLVKSFCHEHHASHK